MTERNWKWWGIDSPDFANHKLQQVTWEQVEYPNQVSYHSNGGYFYSLNKPWNLTKLDAKDSTPAKWFTDYCEDYDKFRAQFQEGDELWTFYADYGVLHERAGLVIFRNEKYTAHLIVWLS